MAIDGLIYILGGSQSLAGTVATNFVDVYNPATNTWSSGPTLLSPRASFCAFVAGPRIFVAGGDTVNAFGGLITASVEYLDTTNNAWFGTTALANPAESYGCAVTQSRMYLFGGYTGSGGTAGATTTASYLYTPAETYYLFSKN